MPVIKEFTTKNPNWKNQVLSAINVDPEAKIKLSFKATNFESTKNPFKNVALSKVIDFAGGLLNRKEKKSVI